MLIQTQFSHPKISHTVTIARMLEARNELTGITLAHEMLRTKERSPVLTLDTRAFAILMNGGEKTTLPLYERATILARAFRQTAEWMREEAGLDRAKLERDIDLFGGTPTLAILKATGLEDTFKLGVVTKADIDAILRYARIGAGPLDSERVVANIFVNLARTTVAPSSSNAIPTVVNEAQYVLELAFQTRLMEWARGMLASPVTAAPVVPDDPKSAMTQRVQAFSRLATIFSAMVVGSHATVFDHLQRFTLHPWMRSVQKGRVADELTSAFEEFYARNMAIPELPKWPEWGTEDLLDRLIAGEWVVNPPKPLTKLPISAPAMGRPLTRDVLIGVRLAPGTAMTYNNATWMLSTVVEAAYDQYKFASQGLVEPLTLLPVGITADQFTSPVAIVPRTSATIPLSSSRLPAFKWHPETANFRFLNTPVSPWVMHTLQSVKEAVAATPDAQYVHTLIEGTSTTLPFDTNFPQLIPVLKVLDEPTPVFNPNLENLLAMLGQTKDDLEEWVELFAGETDATARGLADALRFIGVLATQVGSTSVLTPIQPADSMWYHTTDTSLFQQPDPSKYIRLGTASRAVARPDGTTTNEPVILFLIPFTAIPESACPDIVRTALKSTSALYRERNKPMHVWEWDGTSPAKPLVPVLGWAQHTKPLLDIVLTRVLPADGFTPVHIVPTAKDPEIPSHAYFANEVVVIDGDTTGPRAGLEVAPADRYVTIPE